MLSDPKHLLTFLESAGQGCISGLVSEWPQLQPACRYAAECITALEAENKRLLAEVERLRELVREAYDEGFQAGDTNTRDTVLAGAQAWMESGSRKRLGRCTHGNV